MKTIFLTLAFALATPTVAYAADAPKEECCCCKEMKDKCCCEKKGDDQHDHHAGQH